MASSARLQVPKSQYPLIAKLLHLSPEQYDELINALNSAPLALWRHAYADRVASRVSKISANDLRDILDLLLTLYVVRADAEISAADFVTEFILALKGANNELLGKPVNNWEDLRPRLQQLLSLDTSLGVVSKAQHLAAEHQHAFHRADLFTDARPVFGASVTERPVAVILDHELKITYHRGSGDTEELFVSLSTGNLALLRKLLDRAEAKARSLQTLFESSGVTVIGEEE